MTAIPEDLMSAMKDYLNIVTEGLNQKVVTFSLTVNGVKLRLTSQSLTEEQVNALKAVGVLEPFVD